MSFARRRFYASVGKALDSINPSARLVDAGRAYLIKVMGCTCFLCNKSGPAYQGIFCTNMQAGSIHPNMSLFF
jgi:hypothetical protein